MSSGCEKISGTGRIVRVAPSYVYIYSDRYGSIFSYPASYLNFLPPPDNSDDHSSSGSTRTTTNDLSRLLRVDDVVHFVAVPQKGPNDCRWIAVKIKKRQQQSAADFRQFSTTSTSDFQQDESPPDIIRDVTGTIIELYEQNAYLYSPRYGKIYFPMAASAAYVSAEYNPELYPLNELFALGQTVLFDARRQPLTNECYYRATRVQNLPQDYNNDHQKQQQQQIDHHAADQQLSMTEELFASQDLSYEEGEVVRLFPQYGFIRATDNNAATATGSVYFTLAHFESADTADHDDHPPTKLFLPDLLSVGDRVRFLPVPQPEKNGCRWRGINVLKLDPTDYVIEQLSELLDGIDNNGENKSSSTLSCEVSVQTDQSLWNAFLASQSSMAASKQRRQQKLEEQQEPEPPKKSSSSNRYGDQAVQTRMPPEALLLKAVKEDDDLKEILRQRFPHLMKFIDKTT